MKKDIADVALEFRADIERAFRAGTVRRWEVLGDAKDIDAQTLVLQSAIVELVPDKAGLTILGGGLGGAACDRGAGRHLRRLHGPGLGRVRDARPRAAAPARSTWYGNAQQILANWSNELVELSNTPRDVQVKHWAYFTLMPW